MMYTKAYLIQQLGSILKTYIFEGDSFSDPSEALKIKIEI